MKNLSRPLRRLLMLILVVAPFAPRWAAAGTEIQPHRAIYDMELAALGAGGRVSNVSGRMEFEWARVCDGWTVSQRSRMQVIYVEGNAIDFGWTLSSWESNDGLKYRFFIRRLHGGGTTEEIRGSAELEGPGKPGRAVFTRPEARELALPAGTMFPTKHSIVLLDAAREKQLPLWRNVFDGSGDEGIFGVNAALVAQLAPGEETAPVTKDLAKLSSWRMQLAFFALNKAAAEPEHEQALRIFENGIVDDLILDYEEFSVRAILKELETLEPPDC